MSNLPQVSIYTDGACSGNPGPGGWGAILVSAGREKELSGGTESTTNNRMELTAAIEALAKLNTPCRVRLFSDSAYLINAFTLGWLEAWKRNGWKNSTRQVVSNLDLWKELDRLSLIHEIDWIKLRPFRSRVQRSATRLRREPLNMRNPKGLPMNHKTTAPDSRKSFPDNECGEALETDLAEETPSSEVMFRGHVTVEKTSSLHDGTRAPREIVRLAAPRYFPRRRWLRLHGKTVSLPISRYCLEIGRQNGTG